MVLKMSIVMSTTSPMATETARSFTQSRFGDRGNYSAYISRVRKALDRYPLYFRTAGLATSAAFAALILFTASWYLSNYGAAIGDALGKLHAAEVSLLAQPLEGAKDQNASAVADLIGSGVFGDHIILRESDVNLDVLKDGQPRKGETVSRDAIELLQQAEINLQRNFEARRTQVAFLQLLSFCVLLFCLARLSVGSRRVLVDRVDRIAGAMSAGSAHSNNRAHRDEIARIEERVGRLLTEIANSGASKETRNSFERMTRIQDYLSNAMSVMLRHPFGDGMLRKILYALERTLDLQNTAIVFSEDAAVFHSGRCLFSNREPAALSKQFEAEISQAGAGTIVEEHSEELRTRRVALGFVDATGETSVLLVELSGDRTLEALEIKTLRITASLLSMAAKLDGHDQEARRIAVLEERAAIARELHDSLAQSLSFMKIQLARLQSYQNNVTSESREQTKAITSELRHGLDNAYRELRELLATFRVHMDIRGLDFAIASAIEEFGQRSGLPIALDNRLTGATLTVNEEFHVLHVVREALSNILRHARATNVWITMDVRRNGEVTVTIDDDGIGYRPAETKETSHHGQTIMKERAFSLGGAIDIAPRPESGTRVTLTFTPQKLQYQ